MTDPKDSASVASGIKVEKKEQSKIKVEDTKPVSAHHFEMALDQTKPAFGMDEGILESKLLGGFYMYGAKQK